MVTYFKLVSDRVSVRVQKEDVRTSFRKILDVATRAYTKFLSTITPGVGLFIITEIYIASLQGYYSAALPTLARLKIRVLRLE